jgi:hypothetical protein
MDWTHLKVRLDTATGADTGLDGDIAAAFAVAPAHFTGSIDQARSLVAATLPDWKLHVGFDASGVFPYAALTRGDVHMDAVAGSVPLAILRVAAAVASRFLPSPTPSEPPAL